MVDNIVIEEFEKQPYEEFFVAGDYSTVLDDDETLVLAQCVVSAVDKGGTDASSAVLDLPTMDVDGPYLKVRCRAGDPSLSKYKITFRCVTSEGNKWEIDVKMKVKEY